ncbi:coiled-coil flagellar protein [Thecamonas trahens ATCC 50062]|uniref:Coiled-coil flagellar protein n=1 Tax=Thecamonas trahens ATCC 50062 TaxID=461836 RepID=A0A0L0DNE2_THETB|nr:coiled-coil flagellar protein [Thecamonas trahens ATCC 50062]KNC53536.1 coiled-coil flagellar protein [Thecamonas trahens ATCC 50062]|eukprot:XP_013761857.1 coiled-coil flagellar protein [Thecamonas trahens ATCC 50062]
MSVDVSEASAQLASVLAEINAAVADGSLSPDFATKLSDVYTRGHAALLKSFAAEQSYLKKAKRLNLELAEQKGPAAVAAGDGGVGDDADNGGDGTSGGDKAEKKESGVEAATRELLQHKLDLDLAESRIQTLMLTIEQLELEHAEVKAEYETLRAAEVAEVRPAFERDRKAVQALEKEATQRRSQIQNLKRTKAQLLEDASAAIKAKASYASVQKQLQSELAKHRDEAANIEAATRVFRKNMAELSEEATRRDASVAKLTAEEARLLKELEEAKTEAAQAKFAAANYASTYKEVERAVEDVESDLTKANAQVRILDEHLADMALHAKELSFEATKTHEKLTKLKREKASTLKALVRVQADVDSTRAQTMDLEMQKSELASKVRALQSSMDSAQKQAAKAAVEVDWYIYDFFNEELLGQAKAAQVKALYEENRALERELAALHTKEKSLLAVQKDLVMKNDNLARSCTQLASQLKEAEVKKAMHAMAVADFSKSTTQVAKRYKYYEKLFNTVKNERNRSVNALQQLHQEAAEYKEKLKVLANEIEILRAEITAKDKEYVANNLAFKNACTQLDALTIEVNKFLFEYKKKRDAIDQQLAEVERLNSAINSAEAAMLKLKTQYEAAVEDRNFTGIQLIDRNDELCILYEKANFQDRVLRTGELELRDREEEVRLYKLQQNELHRRVHAKQSLVSRETERTLLAEIERSTAELEAEQAKVQKLAVDLEDPSNELRWRPVPGRDPTKKELYSKLKELEERLNAKEEALLEKSLVLEEISALSRRLRTKAADGQDDTLALAKQVNEFQARIRTTTRKMMATVSELSMYQATAMKLKQEVAEKEGLLAEADERIESGLPPTAEAARAWSQHLAAQRRAALAAAGSIEGDDDMYPNDWEPKDGPPTRAKPRINAYIPHHTTGLLPIPQPFMYPRFEPSVTGSSMRHVRAASENTLARGDGDE